MAFSCPPARDSAALPCLMCTELWHHPYFATPAALLTLPRHLPPPTSRCLNRAPCFLSRPVSKHLANSVGLPRWNMTDTVAKKKWKGRGALPGPRPDRPLLLCFFSSTISNLPTPTGSTELRFVPTPQAKRRPTNRLSKTQHNSIFRRPSSEQHPLSSRPIGPGTPDVMLYSYCIGI